MRVMELTPELFEKTEFTERRKGYDIEEVETFLEQTGTALAQLLARTRHTEERAAHAESRLSQADAVVAEARSRAEAAEQRVQQVERSAAEAASGAAAATAAAVRQNEEAEVNEAAKTLLMAKRTADATVNEARGQAQALLEDSQNRAQRQLNEANAEAVELIRRANDQAEAEYADRRSAVLEEVRGLEARRVQLADVINQLESRLAGYREELGRTAQELVDLAGDPARLGARPTMSMTPDEVLVSADPVVPSGDANRPEAEAVADVDLVEADAAERIDAPAPEAAGAAEPSARAGASTGHASADGGGTATAVIADTAVLDEAQYVDLTSQSTTSDQVHSTDEWGPGSWSQVESAMDAGPDAGSGAEDRSVQIDRPTAAVDQADLPQRDRFMEELDSAVNEAVTVDEDDAMTAFFEGATDSRQRRFGWRR